MRSLREYFAWYAARDLLGVLWHDGQVIAVATIRLFDMKSNYRTEFLHNPVGRFCRANVYGTKHQICLPLLAAKFAKGRDLTTKTVLWHRHFNELGPPRAYTYKQFVKMMRILYGWRQSTTTS
jgi:hypothetical protein